MVPEPFWEFCLLKEVWHSAYLPTGRSLALAHGKMGAQFIPGF
jgi:hypothetical protein